MPRVEIMGILNITPDSFSDGGEYFQNSSKALKRVEEMLDQGANIIDIGGESTRPGSERINSAEEISRVIPVIELIRNRLGDKVVLSIDTYKSDVARNALNKGVSIINSLSGFQFDEKLADVVAESNCQVAIYHIKGTPKLMQVGQIEYQDVISEISQFFQNQIDIGLTRGIKKEQFVLDPGIGFGKSLKQNLEIIKRLGEFKQFNLPILIGVSRKSHLGNLLKEKLSLNDPPNPNQRLEASLAETAIAIINGASIVRTHDVLETKKFIVTLEELI
jgi:dihydropteroate synthase